MTSPVWCIKRKYAELIRMLNGTCLEKMLFEPVPVWTCPLVLLQCVNYLGVSLPALPLNSVPRRILLRSIFWKKQHLEFRPQVTMGCWSNRAPSYWWISRLGQMSETVLSGNFLMGILVSMESTVRKPISDSSLYSFRSYYCMLDITPDIVLNWIILPMAKWMPLTIY